jgi:flagellar biosynthesis component FlhA
MEIIIDVVGLIGLCMLFFGLHSVLPWLAFAVVGVLLMVFAVYASQKKEGG